VKSGIYNESLKTLYFQRNALLFLTIILLAAVLLLSCCLLTKKERVVVVPPFVEGQFWIEKNVVSPSYLEQFGSFLGNLLLTKSKESAGRNMEVVLRHTDPAFFGKLEKKLLEEKAALAGDNAAYVFYTDRVDVDIENTSIVLFGKKSSFVGDVLLSSENEAYKLAFSVSASRIFLKELKKVEYKNE